MDFSHHLTTATMGKTDTFVKRIHPTSDETSVLELKADSIVLNGLVCCYDYINEIGLVLDHEGDIHKALTNLTSFEFVAGQFSPTEKVYRAYLLAVHRLLPDLLITRKDGKVYLNLTHFAFDRSRPFTNGLLSNQYYQKKVHIQFAEHTEKRVLYVNGTNECPYDAQTVSGIQKGLPYNVNYDHYDREERMQCDKVVRAQPDPVCVSYGYISPLHRRHPLDASNRLILGDLHPMTKCLLIWLDDWSNDFIQDVTIHITPTKEVFSVTVSPRCDHGIYCIGLLEDALSPHKAQYVAEEFDVRLTFSGRKNPLRVVNVLSLCSNLWRTINNGCGPAYAL